MCYPPMEYINVIMFATITACAKPWAIDALIMHGATQQYNMAALKIDIEAGYQAM